MRICLIALVCFLLQPVSTSAEVTSVTITSRTILAGGQSFGSTGPYERLVGRIEFALDPADPEERYRGVDDYLRRIRTAAMDLIGKRFMLAEDLDVILERAKQHWSFATREEIRRSADRR